jgi:hypothetical protein
MITRAALVLMLLGPVTLCAQAPVREVTGVVTDSVGTPLIRATVFIPEAKRSATTDSTGHYHLKELPTGPFSVRAAASGFRPKQVDKVQVGDKPVVLDFVLYPFIEGPAPRPVAPSRLPR